MFIFATLCIPAAIVAFKAQKENEPNKKILIANIILGYLSGCYYSLAGAIVGLIQNAREERRNKKAQVVDAQ